MTTRQHRRVRYLETDIYHKILFARKVITRCSVCCNRGVARAGNRGVSHTAYSGQEWSSQDALGAGCGLRATLAKSMLCARHLSYRHARHLCYLERGADCVPLLVTLIKLLNQNNVYIYISIHTYTHTHTDTQTQTHTTCFCVPSDCLAHARTSPPPPPPPPPPLSLTHRLSRTLGHFLFLRGKWPHARPLGAAGPPPTLRRGR